MANTFKINEIYAYKVMRPDSYVKLYESEAFKPIKPRSKLKAINRFLGCVLTLFIYGRWPKKSA